MIIYHFVCARCEQTKPIEQFYPDRFRKSGVCRFCIDCQKILSKEAYESRPDVILAREKRKLERAEKLIARQKEAAAKLEAQRNREIARQQKLEAKLATKRNREIARQQKLEAKLRDAEERQQRKEERRQAKEEKALAKSKSEQQLKREQEISFYGSLTKEEKRKLPKKEKERLTAKYRYHTDKIYNIKQRLRSMIGNVFKYQGYQKDTMTEEILGCSYEEFIAHIESRFVDGMSWDNRDQWDIDHIVPVSWGITEEEVRALNHHSNLQPLWKKDNQKKFNSYAGTNEEIIEKHRSE